MIGRIVRPADFERALGASTRSRSTHFVAHHTAGRPLALMPAVPDTQNTELSTGDAQSSPQVVDELPPAWWLGAVVPKRHARRAVTRTLMKRQIRAAMQRHASALHAGLWVIRLKAPFDRQLFPSASSDALKHTVSQELDKLLSRAAAA